MRRIPVLANAHAGGRNGRAPTTELQQAFAAAGAEADVRCVEGPRLGEEAQRLAAAGAERVVAAGGDGTVSAVAGALAGTGTALAVVPLGTLNHFAKDAGLPLEVAAAARVAVHGIASAIDVAQVNGRVYVNNASLGLYPSAVRERERHGALPKPIAMARAAGTVLRQLPAHHLAISIDGRVAERTTSFLFVGNNVYDTALGTLGTRASLTGGRLCVYTVRRPGRRALVGLAARALAGRLDAARDFEAHEAREVLVGSARRSVPLGIDGELVRMQTPLRFRIRPRALRLVREA